MRARLAVVSDRLPKCQHARPLEPEARQATLPVAIPAHEDTVPSVAPAMALMAAAPAPPAALAAPACPSGQMARVPAPPQAAHAGNPDAAQVARRTRKNFIRSFGSPPNLPTCSSFVLLKGSHHQTQHNSHRPHSFSWTAASTKSPAHFALASFS